MKKILKKIHNHLGKEIMVYKNGNRYAEGFAYISLFVVLMSLESDNEISLNGLGLTLFVCLILIHIALNTFYEPRHLKNK